MIEKIRKWVEGNQDVVTSVLCILVIVQIVVSIILSAK
jgi:hypothetical protein